MDERTIADLLAPFLAGAKLSSLQLNQISSYLDLLLKWNERMNLTAVREPEEIVTRHFGESFFAARHLFAMNAKDSVVDVGSGAGFPGLPFKIWAPALDLHLVESNQRKTVFLKEVGRTLGLQGVTVLNQRAEKVQSRFEAVSLRAVERFEQILPVAHNLVAPNGKLAMLIGAGQLETAELTVPNLSWSKPVRIPGSQLRILLVGNSSA